MSNNQITGELLDVHGLIVAILVSPTELSVPDRDGFLLAYKESVDADILCIDRTKFKFYYSCDFEGGTVVIRYKGRRYAAEITTSSYTLNEKDFGLIYSPLAIGTKDGDFIVKGGAFICEEEGNSEELEDIADKELFSDNLLTEKEIKSLKSRSFMERLKEKKHDLWICYRILFHGLIDDLADNALNDTEVFSENLEYLKLDAEGEIDLAEHDINRWELIDESVMLAKKLNIAIKDIVLAEDD